MNTEKQGMCSQEYEYQPPRETLLNSKKVSSSLQGDFVALAFVQIFRIYHCFLWPDLISGKNENIIPLKGNPVAGFPDNPLWSHHVDCSQESMNYSKAEVRSNLHSMHSINVDEYVPCFLWFLFWENHMTKTRLMTCHRFRFWVMFFFPWVMFLNTTLMNKVHY